ncbi:MAG: hypothetical protein JNM58_03935 [Xanthomonadaceae bacterium]|nr:hypothetical protein [Xanthomonadaceae bacterium]
MSKDPKRPKYKRDGMSFVFGLVFTIVGAYGIWNVFEVLDRARAGADVIHGGISKYTIVTFLILLWGLYLLVFGHGSPPPRPGEIQPRTPIRDGLVIVLLVAALLAGLGLKIWGDAELEALGYERKPLFAS